MNLTVRPLHGLGSIPGRDRVCQGIFPWLITCTLPTISKPTWQQMAQSPLNDSTKPVDNEEEGQSPTMDR